MKLTDAQKAKVEDLLSRMTLEEKIGQMNLESPSIVGGFDVPFEELIEMMTDGRISKDEFENIMSSATRDFHEDDIRAGRVGSMMIDDPKKNNELQKIALEESRLEIPLIIGFDVIHGFRSVYPIAIAEAGAFDRDLFEKTAHMAAVEARAHGINWTFAPMIDIARDSRWGRVSEGPGEDPYLASCFARAKIRGLQNDTESPENYVAACLKHYVAYGACESGRDYNTTSMSVSQLHNVYLPTFKAAVEEGAATAMASFNDLNGVPCTVNPYTLRTVLKDLYGLPGFVVSDANGIKECVTHGIAEDDADAGRQAVNAGLDMDMGTHIYKDHLTELVESGKVTMDVIDDAVRRILSTKMWLGLFDNPYVTEETMKQYEGANLPEGHAELTLEAAEKSIVLLKNENQILPLKRSQKINVVGALAENAKEVCGAWSMNWNEENCVSILDGLKKEVEDVTYYPCCGPEGEMNEEELAKAASDCDVVVAVVGELVSMSGEASSKANIELPGMQKEMLKKLIASGKPVVTVLMNGRPLALGWEAENLPVIVESWHLGIKMGTAVAAVLLGDISPSGKLASSFPSVSGQCPIYYNHPKTGRPGSKSKFTSRYLDAPFEALYPFGYGLSYTTFTYDNLKVREAEEELTVTVDVRNAGAVAGTETVQLYMQDVTASLVRPVKELKDFTKLDLDVGETKTATLTLKKKDMGFYDNDGKYLLEDGLFRIYVGGNSRDCLCEEAGVTF
ncbi:MAG: glycoside hydrolase family 3 N-terminal domain-containing protein [Hespellia sp.]|nr:glycoside hydrolase family 3 N-terminal domain-containing protein [Hespellia sp.]